VDFYIDFISPFSYLAMEVLPGHLKRSKQAPTLRVKPILLPALFNHWGHKGPAEILPKRTFTYEHVSWLANHHGLPMRFPRHHPFNPIPLLRAAVAAEAKGIDAQDAATRIFRFVWRDGHVPDEPAFGKLLSDLTLAPTDLEAAAVKATLRRNGEEAIAAGLFGVPTAVAWRPAPAPGAAPAVGSDPASAGTPLATGSQHKLFWGLDALPMMEAWLSGDAFFDSPAFRAIETLPVGLLRPGVQLGPAGSPAAPTAAPESPASANTKLR
jgi:2-hydroxychromene-2-carboxylate isomerase